MIFYRVTLLLNLQVQPDLEELTTNMEDNEGAETKEEVNLGKLQFSMDYDFQKSEVRLFVSVILCLCPMYCGRRYNGFVVFVRACIHASMRPYVRPETLLSRPESQSRLSAIFKFSRKTRLKFVKFPTVVCDSFLRLHI